jgi:bacteriorhodopsin
MNDNPRPLLARKHPHRLEKVAAKALASLFWVAVIAYTAWSVWYVVRCLNRPVTRPDYLAIAAIPGVAIAAITGIACYFVTGWAVGSFLKWSNWAIRTPLPKEEKDWEDFA